MTQNSGSKRWDSSEKSGETPVRKQWFLPEHSACRDPSTGQNRHVSFIMLCNFCIPKFSPVAQLQKKHGLGKAYIRPLLAAQETCTVNWDTRTFEAMEKNNSSHLEIHQEQDDGLADKLFCLQVKK